MRVDLVSPTSGSFLAGRYRLRSRIASGGMGTVYRAWDERLDREVAVKLLHAHYGQDPEVGERFRAEARHAARVRHPNVVAIIDQDEVDDVPFIVMELVDGPSLREVLRDRAPLPVDDVAGLLAPVCAGLAAVHAAGLVHRDVKPENLLVDERGTVRVADFGIARALDSTRFTPTGIFLGSVDYIAPEVVLGKEATAASDQYALGVVAFEALTGQMPLPAAERLAVALRHAREDVPAPSSVHAGIPPAFDAAVTTATARDPHDRHGSLDEFLSAVSHAVPTAPPDPVACQRRRTWILSTPRADTDPPPVSRSPDPSDRVVEGAPVDGGDGQWADVPALRGPESLPAAPAAPKADAALGPSPRALALSPPGRMSTLAVLSLVLAVTAVGAIASPLLGFSALRRISASDGGLRGSWIAGLGIVAGCLRLASDLLALL